MNSLILVAAGKGTRMNAAKINCFGVPRISLNLLHAEKYSEKQAAF